MSTTGGVFLETILQNVRRKAVDLMLDERIKLQFVSNVIAGKALFDRQTAKLNIITDSKIKDYVAEVWWTNACDLAIRDCLPCELGGPEASTNVQTYELDYCKEVPFSMNEFDFLNNEANAMETFALQLLRAKKILSEDFTRYMITQLNTFVGVNAKNPGLGTVVGLNTWLPATAFGPNGLSYMKVVAEVNQFVNEWLLTGSNFHMPYLNATAGINPDDNGNIWGSLPIVFDELNVDVVNTPSLISYLISQGAYAIGNKAYSKPGEIKDIDGNMIRTLEKDPNLPLEYDLFVKKTCYQDVSLFEAKLKLKAGFFQNPTGCDTGNTGVLSFLCV